MTPRRMALGRLPRIGQAVVAVVPVWHWPTGTTVLPGTRGRVVAVGPDGPFGMAHIQFAGQHLEHAVPLFLWGPHQHVAAVQPVPPAESGAPAAPPSDGRRQGS